jgi:hypothetical protein
MGHPPLMLRPAGGAAPALPDGLDVRPLTTVAELDECGRTLVDAFPTPELAGRAHAGAGPGLLHVPGWRMWLRQVDGRPVATSAVHVHGGINDVE